jgi:hypothetical protein
MKQFSLFDLPADPEQGHEGPSFWWTLKFESMHEQAVAEFVKMYGVEPIFHLAWTSHQVFLTHPDQSIIVENDTGLLTEFGRSRLWETDYRQAKAFRPQDVAPEIVRMLSGTMDRAQWRPMVMAETRVPNFKVDAFAERLAEAHVFEQHWPAYRDAHLFRMFGEPRLLEALVYDWLAGPSGSL